MRPELARLSSSHLPLETFDVKVTSIGSGRSEEEGTRLDVRLQVKRKEDMETDLQVLLVKKDEIRDVTFDIVNLHRYMYMYRPCMFMYTMAFISNNFMFFARTNYNSVGNMMYV